MSGRRVAWPACQPKRPPTLATASLADARRRRLRAALLVVAIAASAGPIAAQSAPPALTAPVNDFANAIDAGSKRELDGRIRALQAASGDVVVVATVPTFQPYADIEEYAVKMFENGGRGIGQKGKDNGDRKSTRLNSSHKHRYRMPSSA